LTFPARYADAGNFALQAGVTITLTWHEAPPGADRYDFVVHPHDDEVDTLVIGSDTHPTNDVAIAWTVPENFGGELRAEAHFADGRVIYSTWAGDIYTGQTPPEGVCSLSSASIGVLDVFREPSFESETFAYITPGPYAEVLERTAGGWYHVDASVAQSLDSQETVTGTGWVSREQGIYLYGSCDNVPLAPSTSDTDTSKSIDQIELVESDLIRGLAWSPDGKTLAIANSNTIWLYDVDRPEASPRTLVGHDIHVTDIAFSPEGTMLASTDAGGGLRLWDMQTEMGVSVLEDSQVLGRDGLAFSPDGATLAVGSSIDNGGYVQLLNLKT
jgi:WD40 repeat protein